MYEARSENPICFRRVLFKIHASLGISGLLGGSCYQQVWQIGYVSNTWTSICSRAANGKHLGWPTSRSWHGSFTTVKYLQSRAVSQRTTWRLKKLAVPGPFGEPSMVEASHRKGLFLKQSLTARLAANVWFINMFNSTAFLKATRPRRDVAQPTSKPGIPNRWFTVIWGCLLKLESRCWMSIQFEGSKGPFSGTLFEKK